MSMVIIQLVTKLAASALILSFVIVLVFHVFSFYPSYIFSNKLIIWESTYIYRKEGASFGFGLCPFLSPTTIPTPPQIFFAYLFSLMINIFKIIKYTAQVKKSLLYTLNSLIILFIQKSIFCFHLNFLWINFE